MRVERVNRVESFIDFERVDLCVAVEGECKEGESEGTPRGKRKQREGLANLASSVRNIK